MIDKEYWRLPDPQSDLIWIDVFEGEDASQISKSESQSDSNQTIGSEDLSVEFEEEEFLQYLTKKIYKEAPK